MYLATVEAPSFEGSEQYDFYSFRFPSGDWGAEVYEKGTENKVGRMIYLFNEEVGIGQWEGWTHEDQWYYDLWAGAGAGLLGSFFGLLSGGDNPADPPAPAAPEAPAPAAAVPAPVTTAPPYKLVVDVTAPAPAAPVPVPKIPVSVYRPSPDVLFVAPTPEAIPAGNPPEYKLVVNVEEPANVSIDDPKGKQAVVVMRPRPVVPYNPIDLFFPDPEPVDAPAGDPNPQPQEEPADSKLKLPKLPSSGKKVGGMADCAPTTPWWVFLIVGVIIGRVVTK